MKANSLTLLRGNGDRIRKIGVQLSKQELQLMSYLPEGLPGECHCNVADKVNTSGGQHIYGWKFQRIESGLVIAAVFHSVWASPTLTLIDITPTSYPIEGDGDKVYFLPSDDNRIRVFGDRVFPAVKRPEAKRAARKAARTLWEARREEVELIAALWEYAG